MNTDYTIIRKQLQDYLSVADERFIRMLHAMMLENMEEVDIEIPNSHKAELDNRLAEHEKNPISGSPAEEVFARLSRKA